LTAESCALANVRCALGGDLRSVLGSSLFLGWPLLVVFGIVVLLDRTAQTWEPPKPTPCVECEADFLTLLTDVRPRTAV
jgi:hypothetical protein